VFLPIGDTPNPQRFVPWVTWGLIAANVLVYLLVSLPLSFQAPDPADPALAEYVRVLLPSLPGVSPAGLLRSTSAYDLFVFAHGYRPAAPALSDLFTSMFLHGGFLHLAGNMLYLYIFGDNVEHRLGRWLYLVVYLATGVVATISFALLVGESHTPLVGASGAISGVLGLYFLLFGRNRVKVFVMLFPFFLNVVLLPARLVLGFYVLVDNLLPLLWGGASNVAYGAHLGGFAAGLAIGWVGERFSWRAPWRDRHWTVATRLKRTPRPSSVESTPVQRVRRALRDDDREAALQQVVGLAGRDVAELTPAECVRLADWLRRAEHPIAASNLLRRCAATHAASPGLAPVYLALGLDRLRQGQPAAAYQHLLSVFDFDPDPATAARARAALDRINVYRRGR